MGCVVSEQAGSRSGSAPTQGVRSAWRYLGASWIPGGVGLEDLRAGGHRDLLAHRANLEGHIHAPHLLASQQDVIGDEGLEAGSWRSNGSCRGTDRDFEIAVFSVGLDGSVSHWLQMMTVSPRHDNGPLGSPLDAADGR